MLLAHEPCRPQGPEAMVQPELTSIIQRRIAVARSFESQRGRSLAPVAPS